MLYAGDRALVQHLLRQQDPARKEAVDLSRIKAQQTK